MQFFRRLVRSKIGGYLALGLLAILGFAFAAGDITGSGGMSALNPTGGVVAKVDGQSITANEVQSRTQRIFERFRQDKPELTMAQFLEQGGLRQVLDEMIAVKALIAYGEKHGMRISKKLVDAEIARTPAFADATGIFSESQFKAILAQQRVSEKELRDDFAGQIARQHLLMAASAGARTPESMVPPYAAMLIELREGEVLAVPSQAFAPTRAPTDAELQTYYAANPQEFGLPEQRKLRYVLLSRAPFDAQATPTEAEIAAAYKSRATQYASRDVRDFSQLILPTQAQAKDFAAKAATGKTLVELANEAGLAATRLDGQSQSDLAAQVSADAAKAAFAAAKGNIVGPFKSGLGWALVRVEDIRTIPGKTIDQVKPELIAELRAQKARQLFGDFVNGIDGKLGEGATLAEVAKSANLPIVETPFLTGEGRDLRNPEYKPDAAVAALLKPGFAMASNDDPQIAQVTQDETVALLAPGDVIAAGPPPLAEVRSAVELRWKLSQGSAKAKEAAAKIVALLAKGVAPDEAMKQAGLTAPQRQAISVRRIDTSQQRGPVPPPLLALLTMRTGSTRVVPMERNLGYLVVKLDKITPEDPSDNASLMQSTRAGLANALGGEYAAQLIAAIERDVDVKRNATVIASVEKALREGSGAAQ